MDRPICLDVHNKGEPPSGQAGEETELVKGNEGDKGNAGKIHNLR